MSVFNHRPCPCGSGRPSSIEYDARGIPLGRMCGACRQRKLKGYRPEVLTDPNYDPMGDRIEPNDP